MIKPTDFSEMVTKYLTEYLPHERGASPNTIRSYTTTLSLFVEYLRDVKKINVNRFELKDIEPDLVKAFLTWLKTSKHNKRSTMNLRMSTLRSFLEFVKTQKVEWMSPLTRTQAIRLKAGEPPKETSYLTVEQMKCLINKPNVHGPNGLRHKLILCLLYDSAARANEFCNIRIRDVTLGSHPSILLQGKGNKIRIVTISQACADLIDKYIKKYRSRARADDPLIPGHQKSKDRGRNDQKLSRDGLRYVIKKYINQIVEEDPLFPTDIHPHSFRRSKAIHMLEAEVPLVYIRDFLGHSDLKTTLVYAKASIKLIEKEINEKVVPIVQSEEEEVNESWNDSNSIDEFLKNFRP